ncbi:MAG: hypothetical protein ACRDQ4_08085 [Pseudonocardiaceae bacterium]
MRLSLSCVERGWRYSRLDEDTFLFDERLEYLARVNERIVRILPRAAAVMGSTSAEGGSLSAVLASWPFKDRFAALHAATVRTAAGEGVLIAGDRGSGKSTTESWSIEFPDHHALVDLVCGFIDA